MRSLLALALVLAAAPAFAQTTYAGGAGRYISINQLALNPFGTMGVDASVGTRYASGLDIGVRAGRETFLLGAVSEAHVGPVVGLTRPVGRGLTGRVEVSALYTSASLSSGGEVTYEDGTVEPETFGRLRALSQDVAATLSRSVPLVGSLRSRPTVGAYVSASQIVSTSGTAEDGSLASVGLHLEAPVSVRVWGRDAAFTPVVRIPVVGNSDATDARYAYAGGGFRLNL